MALTPAQLATFRADILANTNPTVVNAVASGAHNVIADWYNSIATPDFWSWKRDLPLRDVYHQVSPTGSTWNWSFYSGMNAGEQGAWMEMAGGDRMLQMNLSQLRAGLDTIFTGPQGGAAANAHIKACGRELSTNVQRLFAVGTGTTASPAVKVIDSCTTAQVSEALK